jgi:hypothetical protein
MPNVAELIKDHVTLTVDSIDRVYLNGYVPRLQTPGGVVGFLLQRGQKIPSPAVLGQITEAFKRGLRAWADQQQIPWLEFTKGQRKDDVVEPYRRRFVGTEGVVLIGVAQERATGWTATKQVRGTWVHFAYRRRTVCVNHYYVYFIDPEWGPGFLKICGYAPYAIKLCLNGHEWAKRQLAKEGVGFEALDNGFLSCADPAVLQAICDRLAPADFLACFDRWLERLPLPLTAEDAGAGFDYRLSILQLEISRTQVFARPLRGREFFEEVIKENLDLGRPSRVQLLFDRKIVKATPGKVATRVITHGVIPSLHVQYKRCGVKQYFKEGRALRTETTVNDAGDFGIGRRLSNFARLRELGQRINTRLLELETVAHDCGLAEADLTELVLPTVTPAGQPAPALKLGDPRVMALLQALCHFSLVPEGITNGRLRPLVAQLLGVPPAQYTARQMGYDLRRLARKGLLERPPGRLHYVLTPHGRRIALFLTRIHARVFRPGLQALDLRISPTAAPALRYAANELDSCVRLMLRQAKLVA